MTATDRSAPTAIAFLGYLASQERVLADPGLSLADNRMQRGYVEALRANYSCVDVFSSVPATLEQGGSPVDVMDDGIAVRHLGNPSSRLGRMLGKPWVLQRELAGWARAHRDEDAVLIFYNTFLLYCLVAAFIRRRHGVRVVPIAITLPYSAPDARQTWSGRLQDRWSRRLLRHFDAIIAITPFLAEKLAPDLPACVVRGAVPESSLTLHAPAESDRPQAGPCRIVYAGNLSHRYNLESAIAMMDHLPTGEFELHLYGRGALETLVREAAGHSDSIEFHGAIDEQEVASVLREADVLLALLTPDDELAKYSFPSKLFESLASRTPVVTTALPTLEPGLAAHLVVVENCKPQTLADTIVSVHARTQTQRDEAREAAVAHLRRYSTWGAVGARVRQFLTSLEEDVA